MDVKAHCLICRVSDPEASGPFCCESCHAPEALTTVCRQCSGAHRHVAESAFRALAQALSFAVLSKGDIVVMPYCGSCTDISPKRPIGEVEVYSTVTK